MSRHHGSISLDVCEDITIDQSFDFDVDEVLDALDHEDMIDHLISEDEVSGILEAVWELDPEKTADWMDSKAGDRPQTPRKALDALLNLDGEDSSEFTEALLAHVNDIIDRIGEDGILEALGLKSTEAWTRIVPMKSTGLAD